MTEMMVRLSGRFWPIKVGQVEGPNQVGGVPHILFRFPTCSLSGVAEI